jgi:hypothetical protein
VSQRGGVRQVVDGDDVDRGVAHRGAHDIPADAAEPVDPYFDCHLLSFRTSRPAQLSNREA